MEHLWYVYGLLEGCTACCIDYSIDCKLLDNWYRQIALDCPRLPQIAHVTV